MGVQDHFNSETIEENGVFLTETEEEQLFNMIDGLIEMQASSMAQNETDLDVDDRIRNIAGLAFVAGRSFQTEIDTDIVETMPSSVDEVDEQDRKRLARNILEAATYLLGD